MSHADPLPKHIQDVLTDPDAKRQADIDRKAYSEKYAKTTTGAAEEAERKVAWNKIHNYAKVLWEVEALIKGGQSIFDYPGLLAHGKVYWNNESKNYILSLGLHPFEYDDGLGEYGVTFDQSGKILSKKKSGYGW